MTTPTITSIHRQGDGDTFGVRVNFSTRYGDEMAYYVTPDDWGGLPGPLRDQARRIIAGAGTLDSWSPWEGWW